MKVKHLREIMEVRFKALGKALQLQADEYARRLEELNNAHARADAALARTTSREVYERDRDAERIWREAVDKDLTSMKAASAANARFYAAVVTLVGLAFTFITIGLRLWGK